MADKEKILKEKIENEKSKYALLKKAFLQIYEYEKETGKTRIKSYEQINTIKEDDNAQLITIYKEFNDTMKKLETERDKHLGKVFSELLPAIVYYPEKLDNIKKGLMNVKDNREQKEKIVKEQEKAKKKNDSEAARNLNAEIQNKEKEQKKEINNLEKKMCEFEADRVKDNKCLFLQYIYSELKYHAKALEEMSSLFNKINSIDPLLSLPKFEKKYGIKIDLREIGVDIDQINQEANRLKEEQFSQTNKVFGDK
jgi:hypothetical protein